MDIKIPRCSSTLQSAYVSADSVSAIHPPTDSTRNLQIYTDLPRRYEFPGFPKKACSVLLRCREKSLRERARESIRTEPIKVFERLVRVQGTS